MGIAAVNNFVVNVIVSVFTVIFTTVSNIVILTFGSMSKYCSLLQLISLL